MLSRAARSLVAALRKVSLKVAYLTLVLRVWTRRFLNFLGSSSSGVRGIANVKNSCYAAAVLQALATSSSFLHWLSTIEMASGDALTGTLLKVLTSLRPDSEGLLYPWPADIRALLQLTGFSGQEQVDSLEFLQGIISLVEKAAREGCEGGDDFARRGVGLASFSASCSFAGPPTCPFEGLQMTQMRCSECGGSKPTRLEKFTALSLPLTSPSIEGSISKALAAEELPGVDCDACAIAQAKSALERRLALLRPAPAPAPAPASSSSTSTASPPASRAPLGWAAARDDDEARAVLSRACLRGASDYLCADTDEQSALRDELLRLGHPLLPVKRPMLRTHALARLPACLCLHLLRRTDFGARSSSTSHIKFPLSLVLPLPAGGGGGFVFRLEAVVSHHGSDALGHYTCCVRMPPPLSSSSSSYSSAWVLVDDGKTEVIKEQQVLAARPFLLFYSNRGHASSLPGLA